MNEYDYDLWGLDVNNFEIRLSRKTLPAAAVLLKAKYKRKGERNSKYKRKSEINSKYKRIAKEL